MTVRQNDMGEISSDQAGNGPSRPGNNMPGREAGREMRPHIGIFGRCNSGKSSLLNFLTGMDAAIVSPERGTTTDVVRKFYEIPGLAPVVFLDTPGIDDSSSIGLKRVARTRETMSQIDLALIVFREWGSPEKELAAEFHRLSVPYLPVNNVYDGEQPIYLADTFDVVTVDPGKRAPAEHTALIDAIKRALPVSSYTRVSMFGTLVAAGETVLLVCPIDSEAPAGRLILPQVQAIRELLDMHAIPVVVQPQEIQKVLGSGIRPSLVVTDSQVFAAVRKLIPEETHVTSFSILLAGAKGDMDLYEKGLHAVDRLRDGDRVLITENCLHQVSCEDIGRVKIPAWLGKYTGKELRFTFVSGLAPLPDDIDDYALMVQCGGCMVTRSQLQNRIRHAANHGVPVTNYGMLIRKISS